MAEEKKELMAISSGKMWQPYNWSTGSYWSRFFAELRDNKRIMGTKCPKCKRVYIPPRQVCGKCFAKMDEWVEVSDKGEIAAFTVVWFPHIDANTGVEREPLPYTSIWVHLDGADTYLMHYLDETDETKIKIGMRVQAVFAEERKGSIHDIKHFKIIE